MTREVKRYTVRGGNSAFFKDGKFHSHDQSGCPRQVLLRAHGIEAPVDDLRTQKTFNIGFLNEELFVKHYMQGLFTSTDHAINEPITEKVNFEGHADVVTEDLVFELKSVTSKSTWEQVSKGKPKLSNIAQCVNYMLSQRVQKGYLVYSLYAYVQGLELPDIFFEIFIDNDGNILLNGNQTGYSLTDIVSDRHTKAKVLENNEVYPERPVNPTGKQSPCFYCPFQSVCDKWDKATQNKSTEKFLDRAKEIVNAIKTDQDISRQDRIRKATEKFGTKKP
jgi:CRISPR/Cas system-associated exonuclease Cas4 (RecB family)